MGKVGSQSKARLAQVEEEGPAPRYENLLDQCPEMGGEGKAHTGNRVQARQGAGKARGSKRLRPCTEVGGEGLVSTGRVPHRG